MFKNLQEKLDNAIHQLKGRGKITEINVAETIKEIRRALIDADVSFKIAKEITLKIKEKAIGRNVLTTLNPTQLMIKIVYDELVHLMGVDQIDIDISNDLNIFLIVGLQGSGKTTFCAKLANYLKNKKFKNPLLVSVDIYRPAAIDQLQILSKKNNIKMYADKLNTNTIEIATNAIKFAKINNYNSIIIDTAGRLAIDNKMMDEIKKIHVNISPTETLFVVDSMTGQDAVNTAKIFHDILDFSGVVLTKLDGDTRGGAALSIKYSINKPIKFISTGEKIDDLDCFYPKRIANRILGMGDIVSLVEKVQEKFSEEEARNIQKKIAKNQFGFDDFLVQIQKIHKMGNIKDLISMIPGTGIGKTIKNIEINDKTFKKIEAIIHSMTPQERKTPIILNQSRKNRIIKGSGTNIEEVNKLIKQFNQISKMIRLVQSSKGKKIF